MVEKKKEGQKTVRIPRKMVEAIKEFLETDQAEKMGFDSQADVVTAAVRALLVDYGFYKATRTEAAEPRRGQTR